MKINISTPGAFYLVFNSFFKHVDTLVICDLAKHQLPSSNDSMVTAATEKINRNSCIRCFTVLLSPGPIFEGKSRRKRCDDSAKCRFRAKFCNRVVLIIAHKQINEVGRDFRGMAFSPQICGHWNRCRFNEVREAKL